MILILAFTMVSFLATWLATSYGPDITPYVAFFAIGLTLYLKDRIQRDKGWRLAVCAIISGALGSILIPNSYGVVIGGLTAMLVAGLVDVLIVELTANLVLSDLVSSLIDSLIFLSIAFGGGPYCWQTLAKFAGACLWRASLKPTLPGTGIKRYGFIYKQTITGYLTAWIVDLAVCQLRIHRFESADKDPYHSHPWNGCFFILRGGYWEELPSKQRRLIRWFNFIAQTTFHTVVALTRIPTWTIGVVWGNEEWGFLTPTGYVSWQDYLKECK